MALRYSRIGLSPGRLGVGERSRAGGHQKGPEALRQVDDGRGVQGRGRCMEWDPLEEGVSLLPEVVILHRSLLIWASVSPFVTEEKFGSDLKGHLSPDHAGHHHRSVETKGEQCWV